MNTKHCNRCKETKLISSFNVNNKKKDKLQVYCRDCTKQLNNESYIYNSNRKSSIKARNILNRNYNSTLIRRYKYNCGCYVCGIKEPIVLDLHHLDPSTKENNPSALITCSTNTLKIEIRKCIVVCSNCHRLIHANKIKI